ncbi:mucin-13 isoform X8 [Passer domesticus]|uniref:mucin-13 isoform X8 n=1 Tax=Passer domesticus TaxID=48849 RepID=UPI0030FF020A
MRRSVLFAVCLGLVLSLLKEAPAETSAGTTVTPSSIPAEYGTENGTGPDPPEMPTSEGTEYGTENGTDPDPPEMPTSEGTDNSTVNGTDPDQPSAPADNSAENRTDPDQPSAPADNSTVNGTDPAPTSAPAVNGTDNGTATEPTETPITEPSDNSTVNGTDPDPTSAPADNSTVNGTDPAPTSAPAVDFCRGDPCGSSATCISLQSNYTCVCKYGYYYSNKSCSKGQIYPATITVNASYSENLQFVNSTEYQELSNKLSAFFEEAFETLPGYEETVIVKIQRPGESRNAAPGLNVAVTNLFRESSDATAATVSAAIEKAIGNDRSLVDSYEVATHCDIYGCDPKTTVCEGEDFPECKCKPDLEKTQGDDRSCKVCSKTCSALKHKYCIQEEVGQTCKCMINFKNQDGECVACSVGFSGEDCTDNSELILIIVGTVFGAIILSLVIAVSVISVRAKHKQNPEKRSLMKSGYSDINASEDRPSMFPRVQTTSGHANPGYQPNNPYEMRSAHRDRFPERDYDDLYEMSREPTGFRTQSRY